MEIHQLSFAQVIILHPDIAEVFINEGVEMNINMVKEYHNFLIAHLKSPFSLLINKIKSYSYDFEAQIYLANIKEINAMAVVAYSKATQYATHSLATGALKNTPWNLEIFQDRQTALTWLENQQLQTLY